MTRADGVAMRSLVLASALAAVFLGAADARAQAAVDHLAHHASTDAPMSEGEVRKVDREAGKITIRHGPIANLEMPPMTMVFVASDKAMLDRVKAGERVRFTAEKVGGQYTVTRLETAP